MTDQPDYDILQRLEAQLIPLLTRRGIPVEDLQPIGLIGRGASSSVFSMVVNGKYYVLKLYYSHSSFLREQRNRRRLIWPPRVLLTSPQSDNSLGYDIVVTEVPQGSSFTSVHLLDWAQEKLGRHLIELHRLRRTRKVTVSHLRQAIRDVEPGVMKAAAIHGGTAPDYLAGLMAQMQTWLDRHSALMRVSTSLLHNDLWWDNIIVARDDIYLIDWESMRIGDYAEDLAFGRVMLDYRAPYFKADKGFWQTPRNAAAADRFWAGIVDMYGHEFDDQTVDERLRFYLVLQTLRRLSDMGWSTLEPNRELLAIWIGQLPQFWERGLEPAAS